MLAVTEKKDNMNIENKGAKMSKFKLLALSSVMMGLSSTAMAMSAHAGYCDKQDILSTSGYSFEKSTEREITMCIEKSDEGVIVREYSFIYGDNEYVVKGIDESDLGQIEFVKNINGKLVIKTKSKKIYTGTMGYVLSNSEYLPLRNNNEITVHKESVSNVDKVVYYGELIVMTQDKKIKLKTKSGWEELPFIRVIDITQSRFGSYFVITKDGVYAQVQESDNRTQDSNERGIFYRFDKANIATIPVSSLRFRFVENHPEQNFRLVMDNVRNERETFYVYFSVNKALIKRDGTVNPKNTPDYGQPLKQGVVLHNGSRTDASDVSIEKVKDTNFNAFQAVYLSDNTISTKYDGVVELDYKEKFALIDYPLNRGKVQDLSKIIRVLEDEDKKHVYVLRDNGLLQVFDKHSYKLVKEVKGVERIKESYGSIKIYK